MAEEADALRDAAATLADSPGAATGVGLGAASAGSILA
jgi:hypothetical protein